MKTEIITRTSKNEPLVINIRLSDPCNNGHNNWTITADLYNPNSKVLSERNRQAGGCLHDYILKAKKSMKPFIDLHLCNEDGTPMYAVENGFYWYECYKGTYRIFSHMEPEPANFKAFDILSDLLRIDSDECQKLVDKLDSIAHLGKEAQKHLFTEYVNQQKPRWNKESEAAKELLQQLINKNSLAATT